MESLGENTTNYLETRNNSNGGLPFGEGPIFAMPSDLANIFLITLELLWTCCSLLTNGLVLLALHDIPDTQRVKSKSFLMNSVIADVLYSLSNFVTGGVYIAEALGIGGDVNRSCFPGLKVVSVALFQYGQALASAVLSLDRVYAIAAPMTYYTKGYSKLFICLIVSIVWVVSIALVSSFFVPTNNADRLCSFIYLNKEDVLNKIRYPIQIFLYSSVLLVYMALFARVKCQQSAWTKGTESTTTQRSTQSMRLIVTFFTLHLTTFILFLPGPVWGVLFNAGLIKPSPYTFLLMSHILVQMYSLNCVVNPMIIMLKVPTVKAQLWGIWKSNQLKKARSSTSQSQTVSSRITQ